MRDSETFPITPDVDVTLQTSDEVRFGVFRRILVESSPFFRDMFSLPQVPACHSEEESGSKRDAPPVIEVSETSDVVEALLKLVYPGEDPEITTLDTLSVLLAAAMKYDMLRAISTLRRLLVSPSFVSNEPLRVYAIACRHDLESEARVASSYTLRVNILDSPLSEDLKYITAWSYHRLLDLHQRRSQSALKLLDSEDLGLEDVKCMQCASAHYGGLSPPRWWLRFLERAKEELRVRPVSEVVFSMKFLADAGQTGCQRCVGSILESYEFLERVKRGIDELPDTI